MDPYLKSKLDRICKNCGEDWGSHRTTNYCPIKEGHRTIAYSSHYTFEEWVDDKQEKEVNN